MRHGWLIATLALGACNTPETFETVKVMAGDVICSERINTSKLGTGSVNLGVDAGVVSASTRVGVGFDNILKFFQNAPEYEQERRCAEILKEAETQARLKTKMLEVELEAAQRRDAASTVMKNLDIAIEQINPALHRALNDHGYTQSDVENLKKLQLEEKRQSQIQWDVSASFD